MPDPPNFGALKITMQQFYRPNGDSTQKRGVLADVALPSFTSQMDIGESDLDYSIEFDRVNPASFVKYDQVTLELLAELKARSAERRKESEEFVDLDKDITRYRAQKERKFVTLNEAEFLKEREELDADAKEEKLYEDQMDYTTRPVVRRDFYFNEIVNIAVDYVNLLERQKIVKVN